MEFEVSEEFARKMDEKDELKNYRDQFFFPRGDPIYLNGNSLGLQPKSTQKYLLQELDDWKNHAVEGHFKSDTPWVSYHELLTKPMANMVGAKPSEVVIMNTLTVNLHLMMVSFYRPTNKRYKILIEYSTFPSDIYAVKSQIKFHGFDPDDALIQLKSDENEVVHTEQIKDVLQDQGDEIALILIGGVNYYTGQVYDMKTITELGHDYGCVVGFDLAHAVGNVKLELHNWNVDFAVWCTYKYLNSGPGAIGGCFVHQKHEKSDLPRFEGWWGHDKNTRFEMKPEFIPIKGAEGWQISNPPVMAMVPIKSSLELFDEIGMDKLTSKARSIVDYCRFLLKELENEIKILTPEDPRKSGCQLSIVINNRGKEFHKQLLENDVYCDWREPNVIRIAFAPIYNNFSDAYRFYSTIRKLIKQE